MDFNNKDQVFMIHENKVLKIFYVFDNEIHIFGKLKKIMLNRFCKLMNLDSADEKLKKELFHHSHIENVSKKTITIFIKDKDKIMTKSLINHQINL